MQVCNYMKYSIYLTDSQYQSTTNVYKYFLNLKISLFNFDQLFLSVKVRHGIRRVEWCCRGFATGTDCAGLWEDDINLFTYIADKNAALKTATPHTTNQYMQDKLASSPH